MGGKISQAVEKARDTKTKQKSGAIRSRRAGKSDSNGNGSRAGRGGAGRAAIMRSEWAMRRVSIENRLLIACSLSLSTLAYVPDRFEELQLTSTVMGF